MSGIGVLHLADTLDAGGAEVMCVRLANSLPQDRFQGHVCATRRDGPLRRRIQDHVSFLDLRRSGRWDLKAILRLRKYVEEHRIRVLHAHSTAVFVASLVKALSPEIRVIWHDHYGRQEDRERPAWLFRLLRLTVDGVIAVNGKLERWATERLRFPRNRVWLVPNYAGGEGDTRQGGLPGEAGFRIVLLGNVRPQKDHAMMLRAMRRVLDEEPRAKLLLVGLCREDAYSRTIRQLASESGLNGSVALLGAREDAESIVRSCDVGVLSSASEGLPLALLEYGMAGLGVVCTDVGDCSSVVKEGAGKLVAPGDDRGMAEAIVNLLREPELRRAMGKRLKGIVERDWSEAAAVRKVVSIYEEILA